MSLYLIAAKNLSVNQLKGTEFDKFVAKIQDSGI